VVVLDRANQYVILLLAIYNSASPTFLSVLLVASAETFYWFLRLYMYALYMCSPLWVIMYLDLVCGLKNKFNTCNPVAQMFLIWSWLYPNSYTQALFRVGISRCCALHNRLHQTCRWDFTVLKPCYSSPELGRWW